MSLEVFSFTWPVPEAGFAWSEPIPTLRETAAGHTEGPEEPLLMPLDVRAQCYHPLKDHPALFRVLAETAPTPSGILGFANRFGGLGGHALARTVQEAGQPAGIRSTGESFGVWQDTIEGLRQTVELWDLYQNEDVAAMSRRVRWDGTTAVFATGPEGDPHSSVVRIDGLDPSSPSDLFVPALSVIQKTVSSCLARRVTPAMHWIPQAARLGLPFVSDSLGAAVWLQLAGAISGNRRFRACAECGAWYEVSLEDTGYRTSKLYCSVACRCKAYRERREKARRLKKQGRSVKQIAEELGSDVETIKGWIRRKG